MDPRCEGRLNPVSSDVEKQREWIRSYLERFWKGEEVYFAACGKEDDGVLGVFRAIFDGAQFRARLESWVIRRGAPSTASLECLLLAFDHIFFERENEECRLQVRTGNRSVLRCHQRMGAKIVAEGDEDIILLNTRSAYAAARPRYIRILELPEHFPD
jgi:hypothetical protein